MEGRFKTEAVTSALPTEMTVGGRTYEILGFLKGDEESVPGDVMVSCAKEMGANLGKDDCDHLLAHQNEIPVALRGKIVFVFPDMRSPGDRGYVAYLYWLGGRWVVGFYWLGGVWVGSYRVLRRKSA